jgi:hypothetical protein
MKRRPGELRTTPHNPILPPEIKTVIALPVRKKQGKQPELGSPEEIDDSSYPVSAPADTVPHRAPH